MSNPIHFSHICAVVLNINFVQFTVRTLHHVILVGRNVLDSTPKTLGRENFSFRPEYVDSLLRLVDLLLNHSEEVRVRCNKIKIYIPFPF